MNSHGTLVNTSKSACRGTISHTATFDAVGWTAYLHPELLVQRLYWKHNGFIPNWIQVFINHFAFIQGFPIQLKLHIWIARTLVAKHNKDCVNIVVELWRIGQCTNLNHEYGTQLTGILSLTAVE